MIRFNFPYATGKEIAYIQDTIRDGRLSGDGIYTQKCKVFFKEYFGFTNNFFTTSGTTALEMAALLMEIIPGDEVIMPSYTFVSTANAFVLRGAKIVFADSLIDHPNIDHDKIESLVTQKTKAIVVVHYAGVACHMDKISEVAKKHKLWIVEDAAQAICSTYNGIPLGALGDFAAMSFHETKNIVCGEGGLLIVKDNKYAKRAEIIREKGTNRSSFFRGEVDKYGWVDIGSSFLASELLAAFLYAQLEELDKIQTKRKKIWNFYNEQLAELLTFGYELPAIPSYAHHNSHIFYLLCPNLEIRSRMINFLNANEIKAVFHYLPLHQSPYYSRTSGGTLKSLPNAEKFGDCLLRLPIYPDLSEDDQNLIIKKIIAFVKK